MTKLTSRQLIQRSALGALAVALPRPGVAAEPAAKPPKGAAEKQGFDTFFGYYNQGHAHDYYTSHLFRNSERVELSGPAHSVISYGERTERKSRYSHYAIFDETIKFIRESAASGKPFFCYAP